MDFRERLREEISFSGLSYKELAAKSDKALLATLIDAMEK